MNIDLGLNAYTFEARLILNATPTVLGGLLGRNGTSAGFFITPTLTLATYASGSLRYQTAANFFLQDGLVHTYRLEHDAGGAWRAYRDGSLFGSGTFTTSVTATNQGWIGQGNNSSNTFCSMDLEYLEVTGVTNAQKWSADLSGGTGSTLPTVSGTNQATLINFPTDNSQWIFYSSGSYTLTADGGTFSYSGAPANTLFNRLLSSDGATYAYSGGIASLLLNRILQSDGASFAYSGGTASTLYNRVLSSAGSSFGYSGGIASLVYTPAGTVYTLNADGAIYSYSGGNASLLMNRSVIAYGVSYGYLGGDATLRSSAYPSASLDAYTVSYMMPTDTVLTASVGAQTVLNAIIEQSTTLRYSVV
jgi:hypothetical protein